MKLSVQKIVLGLALIVTIWLTWKTGQSNVPPLSAPTRSLPSETNSALNIVANNTDQLSLLPRTFSTSKVNLFASPVIKSFKPRTVQKPHITQPAPVAPTLPFKFIGHWKDDQKTQVFIDVAGEVTLVKAGQLLNAQYKVINVQDNAIHFLYLPLNQKQTMFIGKTNHE